MLSEKLISYPIDLKNRTILLFKMERKNDSIIGNLDI